MNKYIVEKYGHLYDITKDGSPVVRLEFRETANDVCAALNAAVRETAERCAKISGRGGRSRIRVEFGLDEVQK